MEKKTPLYQWHVEHHGLIVPYAGYLLPVQYQDIIIEHMQVRTKAGLFDISHMGRIDIRGNEAEEYVNYLCTNQIQGMKDGQIKYALLCNDEGGVLDDVLVYRKGKQHFYMVVNASNREKIVKHLSNQNSYGVFITDVSSETAALALQGPNAKMILKTVIQEDEIPLKYYTFLEQIKIEGITCDISKTGYTGEEGYEIICEKDQIEHLWKLFLMKGEAFGLIACGLGARDTLRLEAAMPLYGHELSENITPLEAGLTKYIAFEKKDFIGKAALLKQRITKTRVGIKVLERGIVRENCTLMYEDREVGYTTSGTFLPYIKGAYAMAYVELKYSLIGTKLIVNVRNRQLQCEVCSLPFYKKETN